MSLDVLHMSIEKLSSCLDKNIVQFNEINRFNSSSAIQELSENVGLLCLSQEKHFSKLSENDQVETTDISS